MNKDRIQLALLVVFGLMTVYLFGFHVMERFWPETVNASLSARQGQQLMRELGEVKNLLSNTSKPEPSDRGLLTVSVVDRPALGKADAPLTIVEFTDYECPFCAKFHQETYPRLKKAYVDTGLVRFVVMDLPLGFHKQAIKAAQAAHCAGEQGKYFDVSEKLYTKFNRLNPQVIRELALEAGVAKAPFDKCYESTRHLKFIQESLGVAEQLGLGGTPTFVIGPTTPNQIIKGFKIVGAHPYESFDKALKGLLKAAAQ